MPKTTRSARSQPKPKAAKRDRRPVEQRLAELDPAARRLVLNEVDLRHPGASAPPGSVAATIWTEALHVSIDEINAREVEAARQAGFDVDGPQDREGPRGRLRYGGRRRPKGSNASPRPPARARATGAAAPPVAIPAHATDRQIAVEFYASPELQQQFRDAETFVAYHKAAARARNRAAASTTPPTRNASAGASRLRERAQAEAPMSRGILSPQRIEDVERSALRSQAAREALADPRQRERLADALWQNPLERERFGNRDVISAYLEGIASGRCPIPRGGSRTAAPRRPSQPASAVTEDTARAEFSGSAALREEFGTCEIYVAYRMAEASGRIRRHAPGA